MIKIIRMQRRDDVRSDERDEMIKIILMQRWMMNIIGMTEIR
jgi:hypothetical protein